MARDAGHCPFDGYGARLVWVEEGIAVFPDPPPRRGGRCCLFPNPIYRVLVSKAVMRFKVGEIVHNKITQEDARIMRIADLSGHVFCYVVSVAPIPALGAPLREVIWRRSEVTRSC